jgi:hypothetical protein
MLYKLKSDPTKIRPPEQYVEKGEYIKESTRDEDASGVQMHRIKRQELQKLPVFR